MKKESDKKVSEYNTMEYETPPVSEWLAKELDAAILESENPNSVFYTLEEIISNFKNKRRLQNV